MAAILKGETYCPENFFAQAGLKEKIASLEPGSALDGGGVLGLFSGGTLAHESRLILEGLLDEVSWNEDEGRHRILDLGDDRYTVGKPHPMIDPESRAGMLARAAMDESLGVVLFDLILGRGSSPDPAGPLALAITEARDKGRRPHFVASVVGTADDPQDMEDQVRILQNAGVAVLPSNAQAARFAAALVKPELIENV